jgi:pyruvate dehydrogenase complex dehydrogenase (E1) component
MNVISGIFTRIKLWWMKKNVINIICDEALDFSLEMMLRFMRLYLRINESYRRNIDGFNARYSIKTRDGRIDVGIIFSNGKMSVKTHTIKDSNISIEFKDGKAVREFLLADSPDVIGAILNGDVSYEGNLNYLSKFAYMSKNLKTRLLPG